jgi:RNA-binding protein
MRGPIQSVEVSYLVHATEDDERLKAAVAKALGMEGEPEVEALEGHFGNRIERVRFHVIGKEATELVGRFGKALPEGVRREVLANIEAGMDEHSSLFLRLDKQAMMEGRLALGSADPVRVKVKPRLFELREEPARFYARMVGG